MTMIKEHYQHILDNDTAKQIGKVGVLYGGVSDEREVSLWSGQAVYDALIKVGVDAELIDVTDDFLQVITRTPIDYAFIVLHGRGGEDGTVQAILDWLKIPYTGSGVQASAIAMDKVRTKQIWQACGLPVLPSLVVNEDIDYDDIIETIGYPMAVKPVNDGSSIGIYKVRNKEELIFSVNELRKNNVEIMAEMWLEGTEVTLGIIADKALPLIKISVNSVFYDYNTKYITGAMEYKCNPFEEEYGMYLQDIMLKAYYAIGCKDMARVDAIIDEYNEPWLLEINTIPGMTEKSLVPKAAQAAGLDFEETVLTILKTSWENNNA